MKKLKNQKLQIEIKERFLYLHMLRLKKWKQNAQYEIEINNKLLILIIRNQNLKGYQAVNKEKQNQVYKMNKKIRDEVNKMTDKNLQCKYQNMILTKQIQKLILQELQSEDQYTDLIAIEMKSPYRNTLRKLQIMVNQIKKVLDMILIQKTRSIRKY
ncbi:unnamed protein product [Paramecium octaurelia]|uniref:Uncharacterized protein n=1 Tax=Paramecium octaurelia TaxID=43137 RepID=A0A8S1Y1G8_PAROT|nr:unnamed protein product [Paramecium octaurelia]